MKGDQAGERYVDPGLLEILGAVSEALGLAEHIQKVFPLHRLKAQRRHGRIEKLLNGFAGGLDDARAAIRLLQGVTGEGSNLPPGTIAFAIPASELPLYRRGLQQLQTAIRTMTDAAYELEALTEPFADDAQRFYRISTAGAPVLRTLAAALARLADDEATLSIAARPVGIGTVLAEVDRYLANSAATLSERDKWLQG